MGLLKTIRKRDGSIVEFDSDRIKNALLKSGEETGEFGIDVATSLTGYTTRYAAKLIKDNEVQNELTVELVQDLVETALLNSEYKKTAKAYILYREKRNQERKPDIFKPRVNLRPNEYPQADGYKEAIQHSYWLHTAYDYTSDIQDYRVGISEEERNAIKNSMLAIAQVEVSVKNFWGELHLRMPKPEIGAVGSTFAGNEVIHFDAYSHLLKILGMESEFERIMEIPELMQRVEYLTDSVAKTRTGTNREFTLSLILFSLFIEHVSLFSQFLIIMSFNKHRNNFKGISNVIEATSKEEHIHGLFGIELVHIIKKENPEWFDDEMEQTVIKACRQAYKSEEIVIDWIYEKGDLDFIPKETVKEFIKDRLNNSLRSIGYEAIFEVNEELLETTDWFEDEIIGTKHTDFFVKDNVNYTRFSRSIGADDLF